MLQPCRHLVRVGPILPGEVAAYPADVAERLRSRGSVTFEDEGDAAAGPPVPVELEAATAVPEAAVAVAPPEPTRPEHFRRFRRRGR